MNEIKTGAQIKASTGNSKATRETMQSLMDKGVEYCMPLMLMSTDRKNQDSAGQPFRSDAAGLRAFYRAALDGLGKALMTTSSRLFQIQMPLCSFPGGRRSR